MKNWVETIDGRIVQVEIITDNIIQGRLVDESGPKLQYGEEIIFSHDYSVFGIGSLAGRFLRTGFAWTGESKIP